MKRTNRLRNRAVVTPRGAEQKSPSSQRWQWSSARAFPVFLSPPATSQTPQPRWPTPGLSGIFVPLTWKSLSPQLRALRKYSRLFSTQPVPSSASGGSAVAAPALRAFSSHGILSSCLCAAQNCSEDRGASHAMRIREMLIEKFCPILEETCKPQGKTSELFNLLLAYLFLVYITREPHIWQKNWIFPPFRGAGPVVSGTSSPSIIWLE